MYIVKSCNKAHIQKDKLSLLIMQSSFGFEKGSERGFRVFSNLSLFRKIRTSFYSITMETVFFRFARCETRSIRRGPRRNRTRSWTSVT